MSGYFTERLKNIVPYTPGEQPRDKKYIKLNTNESPFPPSPSVARAVYAETEKLMLYSDPECVLLREKMAEIYNVPKECIIMTNGSDEILNFAFIAFADEKSPLVFPDITYGFYPVFANINNIPYREIPLNKDFTINVNDYIGIKSTVVIANPNAPTGIALKLADIEKILKSNPDNVVIIDEAYVDFGGESAVSLIGKYDNLLVTGTFSKSRSMAGARLGFGIGNKDLICDINTIKYSTNPYNINRLTAAAGIAALNEQAYYDENIKTITENREKAAKKLSEMGFTVLPSKANFLFAKSDSISGEALYTGLKEKGVLIRHFTLDKIKDYNRITIGTWEQMEILFEKISQVSEENK